VSSRSSIRVRTQGRHVTEQVVLIAAGGLAREVIGSLAGNAGISILGILDDEPTLLGTSLCGYEVLGATEAISELSIARIAVCAGRGVTRRKIVSRLTALGVTSDRYFTVVDPSVRVPRSCAIGEGSIVLAQCALTADVRIGRHVVVMPNVTLTHDTRIEDFATLCAGVSLGGAVSVGTESYLGMNSSVREGTSIGAGAVLGMGAVLLEDLPMAETWVGIPAAVIGSLTGRMRAQNGPVAPQCGAVDLRVGGGTK
jgi:sugar O-acyltransferase (sialic acid O-acetyltransferase NeuD family)